jgi:hypothetical protein
VSGLRRGRAVAVTLATAAVAAHAGPAWASFAQEPSSPITVGANPYGVVAADFNGDGRQDVAAVNGTSSSVSVLLRRAAGGGFTQEAGSPFGVGSGPNYAVAADLDHASGPDIAVADYAGGAVSVLLRRPAGGFTVSSAAAPSASAVTAADFNHDGFTDLAAPSFGGNVVTILLGKSGGGYNAGPTPATGTNPRYVVAGDFTGDGKPDLAVSNYGSGTVTVLRGTGTGSFVQEAGSPIAVGGSPFFLAAADFNGDGRLDLAATSYATDSVTVLLRNGTGTGFVKEGSAIPAGDGPVGLVAADFDGDHRPDLAVGDNIGKTVTVLLRKAAGGFGTDPSSPIRTDLGAHGLAAADFDGDGRPDIAVANDGDAKLTILLNTTPPPVAPAPTPSAGPSPSPTPAPARTKRIKLTVRGTWAVSDAGLRLGSLTVRGLRAHVKVKLSCPSCHVKQTLTAKGSKLGLKKLRGRLLKRGKGFTLTATGKGMIGDRLTLTVKRFGHRHKDLVHAAVDPFAKRHRCLPVGSSKPRKTCA